MCKGEATEYDTDYANEYDGGLNTILIFVRRSSYALVKYLTCSNRLVCSLPSAPLVIDVHSNLQPNPNG